uniref:Uncharacterized protein n=1 Tax=Vombatus ursinus TaxID=29139 RepID=A0A4X2JLZ1_VOMUR
MTTRETRTSAVPDLDGDPPSKAVRVNLISGYSSPSRALSNTSSGYLLPSPPERVWTSKWELGKIV